MSLSDATVWIFLAIFFLSAVIALASLPGWISLEEYYKKKLFQLLILEVTGCIVGFGAASARAILVPPAPPAAPPIDLRAVLLASNLGWESQDANEEEKTRFRFEPGAERSLRFIGETYKASGYPREFKLIRKWVARTVPDSGSEQLSSGETVLVPLGAASVRFKATRSSKDILDHWSDAFVTITLYPETAIRGTIAYEGSTEQQMLAFTSSPPK